MSAIAIEPVLRRGAGQFPRFVETGRCGIMISKRMLCVAFLASTCLSAAAYADPNDSLILQLGHGNTALAFQQGGNNEQGTLQVGRHNFALTLQSNGNDGDGEPAKNNRSGTVQVGRDNAGITLQKAKDGAGLNSSFIGQFGEHNFALAAQSNAGSEHSPKDSIGGDNHQATLQFGSYN